MMKSKWAVLVLLLLIIAPAFSADATIERTSPPAALPGTSIQVSLKIIPGGSFSSFDVAELVPSGWLITSWSIAGYPSESVQVDTRSRTYQGKVYNAYHWKLSAPISSEAVLTYSLSIPSSAQLDSTESFVTIWTSPSGFGSKDGSIRLAQPSEAATCGDGTCNGGDTCSSCPQDCGVCWTATCGDGTCSAGETCSSCAQDCGGCAPNQPGKSVGDMIFGTPESGPGLLQTYGIPIAILLGVVLVIFIIATIVRKMASSIEQRKLIEREMVEERKVRPQVSSSERELRETVMGKVTVRPVQTKRAVVGAAPELETTDRKIAVLKKSMIKISKLADDIGKGL
jgi:hypothetical protein